MLDILGNFLELPTTLIESFSQLSSAFSSTELSSTSGSSDLSSTSSS